MITGRLVTYKDHYYAMLNLKHEDGSRYQKRINLDLLAKNNKRQAEAKLAQLQQDYDRIQLVQMNSSKSSFSTFARDWFKKKTNLSATARDRYDSILEHDIIPFFAGFGLICVTADDIENFYSMLRHKGLSETTVYHYQGLLNQIFTQAYRREIILKNPMDLVERIKRPRGNYSYYSATEAKQLWDAIQGHKLEIIIKLALFYGLRRSEALGIRWESVDFENEVIIIENAVVNAKNEKGKRAVLEKPELKEEASRRTLPMDKIIKDLLLAERSAKKKFKSRYVCTDKKGKLIKPDEVTRAFSAFLEKEGMRHVRFQDLRHSCASLLISKRTPLIEVQHWLGHKTMLTTANYYAHLEYESKLQNAETMKKFSEIIE